MAKKEQLTEEGFEEENVFNAFASLEKKIVRKSIVEGIPELMVEIIEQ